MSTVWLNRGRVTLQVRCPVPLTVTVLWTAQQCREGVSVSEDSAGMLFPSLSSQDSSGCGYQQPESQLTDEPWSLDAITGTDTDPEMTNKHDIPICLSAEGVRTVQQKIYNNTRNKLSSCVNSA